MTATIVIACPKCRAHLRGPAEMEGKKVRCKNCNNVFHARPLPEAPKRPRNEHRTPTPGKNGHRHASTAGRHAGSSAHAAPDGKSKPEKSGLKAPSDAANKRPAASAAEANESTQRESGHEASASVAPVERDPMAISAYGIASEDLALKQMEESKSKTPLAGTVGGETNQAAVPSGKPYGLTDIDLLPRCPHCAYEMPSEEAIICLHCGYNTQTRTHIVTKRTIEHGAKDIFVWRLPGIACALVALGAVAFIGFLWVVAPHLAEEAARPRMPGATDDGPSFAFMAALPFRIYASVFAGVVAWFFGRFGYNRLIVHPNPPEIVKGK